MKKYKLAVVVSLLFLTLTGAGSDIRKEIRAEDVAKPADTAIDVLISVRERIDALLKDPSVDRIVLVPMQTNELATARRNAAVNREMHWYRNYSPKVAWIDESEPRPDLQAGSHLWRDGGGWDGTDKWWWYERMKNKRDEIATCKGGKIDFVMLGDSVTHYWERRWGRDVVPELRRTYSYLNLGYGGDRAETLLWRCRNGELDGYEAKVVSIAIGGNNITDDADFTAKVIGEIVRTVRAKQPRAKVLLMPVVPRCNPGEAVYRVRGKEVSALIRRFADGKDVIWCDCFDRIWTHGDGRGRFDMRPDGTHPSPTGIRMWRDAMLPYLERFTGKRHIPEDPVLLPCERRWVSFAVDFADDSSVRKIADFVGKAKRFAYNGIVLDAFGNAESWDAATKRRCADAVADIRGKGLVAVPVMRQLAPPAFANAAKVAHELLSPKAWLIVTNGFASAESEWERRHAEIESEWKVLDALDPSAEIILMARYFTGRCGGFPRRLTALVDRDIWYFAKCYPTMALFDREGPLNEYQLHEASEILLNRYAYTGPGNGFVYWTTCGDYGLMEDAARLGIRRE